MKRYFLGLPLLLLSALCGVFGCADGRLISESQVQSSNTASSQPSESDLIALKVEEMIKDMEQTKARIKQLQQELDERLGDRQLKLNERYCFAYEDGYIVAGSNGTPITSLEEIQQYYPSWNIAQQIDTYTFESISILSQDITFAKQDAVPLGMEENVVSKVVLDTKDVVRIDLYYANDTQQLWVRAYPNDVDGMQFGEMGEAEEIKKINAEYTLFKSDEFSPYVMRSNFLRWKDAFFTWEKVGS